MRETPWRKCRGVFFIPCFLQSVSDPKKSRWTGGDAECSVWMICQAGHFLLEENGMARRSDERDAARAEYIARMEKDGEVNLRQLADDLHALARHVAQGVGWIDVLHNPCKAVSLVKTGCHPKQDLQSGMKRLTCHAFKLGS